LGGKGISKCTRACSSFSFHQKWSKPMSERPKGMPLALPVPANKEWILNKKVNLVKIFSWHLTEAKGCVSCIVRTLFFFLSFLKSLPMLPCVNSTQPHGGRIQLSKLQLRFSDSCFLTRTLCVCYLNLNKFSIPQPRQISLSFFYILSLLFKFQTQTHQITLNTMNIICSIHFSVFDASFKCLLICFADEISSCLNWKLKKSYEKEFEYKLFRMEWMQLNVAKPSTSQLYVYKTVHFVDFLLLWCGVWNSLRM